MTVKLERCICQHKEMWEPKCQSGSTRRTKRRNPSRKEVKAGHGLEKTVVTDTIRLFRYWFSTIIWFYNTQLLKSTIITIKRAVDSTDANSWIWFSPTEHANAFCSQPTVISQFFHRQMHQMSLLCTRGNHQASEQITAAYISLFKEKYIHVGGAHLPFPGRGNVRRHKIRP